MMEFKKLSMAEIKKKINYLPNNYRDDKSELRRLHRQLHTWIRKIGKRIPKRHGSYWNVELLGHTLRLDDYNSCIEIDNSDIGCNWGEFSSDINIKTYKYFIGLLYQKWLKESGLNKESEASPVNGL